MLVELGVLEQRYDAVKKVLEGRGTVTEVAERYGVTRQSLHNWLRRYRERGMAGRWIVPSGRGAVPTGRRPEPSSG